MKKKLETLERALASFNHKEPLINSTWFMYWLSDHLHGQMVTHISRNDEILCVFMAAHLPMLEAEIAALKAKIEKRDKSKEKKGTSKSLCTLIHPAPASKKSFICDRETLDKLHPIS